MIDRRGTLGLLAVATALSAGTAAAHGAGRPGVAAAGAQLPARAFVLTPPGRDALERRSVHVLESGRRTLAHRLTAPAGTAFHESFAERFWRSDAAVAALAAFAAAMAAVAAVLTRRLLRRSVASRVAAFLGSHRVHRSQEETEAERLALLLERWLAHMPGWRSLAREAEIARIAARPVWLAGGAAALALVVGLGAAVVADAPVLVLLGLVPPILVRAFVARRLRATRRRFEEELPVNLQVLASAMRTGYGLSGAIGIVVRDAVEPARSEFERALADERLGVPLEDGLWAVAERMQSHDLEQVALVAGLHRETGGNTAEVFDRVHDTVRERAELRRTVQSLTAEGRLTRWILTALPAVLAGLITLLNRTYLRPLVDTTTGTLLVGLAVAMLVAGSLVIKRIVEIEV